MLTWIDNFTGTSYTLSDEWIKAVYAHLTDRLIQSLKKTSDVIRKRDITSLHAQADLAAAFWSREYYDLVFPLRLGLEVNNKQYDGCDLFNRQTADIDLDPGRGLRERFLHGQNLSPILPAPDSQHELIADRLLTQTALLNIYLRQQGITDDTLNAVRLGSLVHLLLKEPHAQRSSLEQALPAAALSVAQYLNGQAVTLPNGLAAHITRAQTDDYPVYIGLVAVQRIKRYVFETAGLNEIRGASTLLDEITECLSRDISNQYGPELILRAAGSTLEFLAPEEANWRLDLKRAYFEATGVALPAVAITETTRHKLQQEYHTAIGLAYYALNLDRDRAEWPHPVALPFETRCQLCQVRAADGWDTDPEDQYRPICQVCATKREIGQRQRRRKTDDILTWLDLKGERKYEPEKLGVQPDDPYAPDLENLIGGGRRDLIATIYSDGNNFGSVAQQLESLAQGLQWTHRIEGATRAAVALALAHATQKAASHSRGWTPGGDAVLDHFPFQVLALGGDDVSLLTWGPVGVWFAQRFVQHTDTEFRHGSLSALPDRQDRRTHLAFSLGLLLSDVNAPVRTTVEFAESQLMKWAKTAFRKTNAQQGNVALLFTSTPEQIPSDLKAYREQTYALKGGIDLALTLRPFSEKELNYLIETALKVREHNGVLQRTVGAFTQTMPLVALLHYVYQAQRTGGRRSEGLFATLASTEDKLATAVGVSDDQAHYPALRLDERYRFGLDVPKPTEPVWYSPLWDLLELVKILE